MPPCLQLSGDITYNGHKFDEFNVIRTAAYIDERDNHLAHLTVRETFTFSAECLGQGAFPTLLQEAQAIEK